MTSLIGRRLRIHGIVQGVGFRYSLQREAMRLGLHGWVRNCRDGTVEALALGGAQAVEELVAWARRGPPAARVQKVEIEALEASEIAAHGQKPGFEQRPTA